MVVELNGFICNSNIGNKAKSLIDLHRYGFKVPTSVALDTKEYFNTIFNVKDKINMLLKRIEFGNIQIISKQIGILLDDIHLSSIALEEIHKFMNDSDNYILRCSVDGVDENYSYSGLFSTKYNINKYNIEENILSCYRSLFSYNSLCYMLKNNIDYSSIAVAIIIQKEVKTSTLGYVTTMNPVTVNTSEYNIKIVQDKLYENYSYNYLIDKYIQEDKYAIIDKERIEETIELVKNVSANLGYPVEIELAYTKSDIYILQTRELNSILYENQDTLWGNEMMSCKKFMYSLVEKNYQEVIKEYYKQLKLDIPTQINALEFNNCLYNILNISSIVEQYTEYDYNYLFNKLNIYPQIDKKNGLKIKFKRYLNQKKLNDKIESFLIDGDSINIKYHEKYNDYCRDMSKVSAKDIEKKWLDLVFIDYKDIYKNYTDIRLLLFIERNRLYNNLKDYINDKEFDELINIREDRIDYKIEKELNELISKIKSDEDAYRYWFSSSTLKILKNYKEDNQEYFHKEFKQFINSYGYLSYFKFDLSESFYVEDVEDVIRDIKKQLANFEILEANKKKREIIENKLIKVVKPKLLDKYIEQIKQIQQLIVLYSKFKDYLLKFNFLVKRYTKMLAKLYLNKKLINLESDIWYLDIDTIYDYTEGEIDFNTVNSRTENNKIYFNSFRNFRSIEYTGSMKLNLDTYDYKAQGISTGVIKGNVRKIKSLKELDTLTSDDILVTKTINNNLLFQLPNIKGIIVSDFNLSNSVKTTIRELKIPCVILDNCSKKLSNNKLIKLDASNGYIKNLKK